MWGGPPGGSGSRGSVVVTHALERVWGGPPGGSGSLALRRGVLVFDQRQLVLRFAALGARKVVADLNQLVLVLLASKPNSATGPSQHLFKSMGLGLGLGLGSGDEA